MNIFNSLCTVYVVSKLSYVNAQGLYPSRNYFFYHSCCMSIGDFGWKICIPKTAQYRGGKSILEPGFKTDEVVNIYAAKGKFLFSTSSRFLNANLTLNDNLYTLNANLHTLNAKCIEF